jgi:hypothetical protein
MKKLLLFIVASLFSITASAQYMHWHSRHGPYYSPDRWVAPLIIGGVIGYELNKSRTNTVIVQQPTVIVEQQMECTPWKEIQQLDGTITRERTCYQK